MAKNSNNHECFGRNKDVLQLEKKADSPEKVEEEEETAE